jgi:signal transduction histidine kinase
VGDAGTTGDGAEPADVVVEVATGATGEGGDALTIRVSDHGPGVLPADRERVLKRFVRLDASRSAPGTGLGLSLVTAVARMHGGRLRLEDNRPGLSAELVLPLAPA